MVFWFIGLFVISVVEVGDERVGELLERVVGGL